eukprot:COSAG02_NODE_1026_length_15134_cov_382.979714_8_plen_264_part_00
MYKSRARAGSGVSPASFRSRWRRSPKIYGCTVLSHINNASSIHHLDSLGKWRTHSSLIKKLVLLSIMIVNELTVFASLTVRFLRGVCQVLRSAQRLTVSRPGLASARQRTPPLSRVASGGSPPPLRVGCAVLLWMASPAREGPASAGPYPPDAVEPLLLELRGMDEDSRLAAAGVGAAFAASFPSMPDEVFLSSLTAVHQPDVPGFTIGSALLRMDDCLCGSRVLEPLVCHPFSVGISLYTLLSPSSLRTCPERCCSIVYYDC